MPQAMALPPAGRYSNITFKNGTEAEIKDDL